MDGPRVEDAVGEARHARVEIADDLQHGPAARIHAPLRLGEQARKAARQVDDGGDVHVSQGRAPRRSRSAAGCPRSGSTSGPRRPIRTPGPARPEVDADRVAIVMRHRLAQHPDEGILLGRPSPDRIHASPPSCVRHTAADAPGIRRPCSGIGERDVPHGQRVARVGGHHEAEVARQVTRDRLRLGAAVGRAVDATVVLLVQPFSSPSAAMTSLWTHCPKSGNRFSGSNSARTPLLRVDQVAPPSCVSNTPTAEIPTHIRSPSVGWGMIVWRMSPPAPGPHSDRL